MPSTCVKYFFMALCCSYFFVKLLHLSPSKKAVAATVAGALPIALAISTIRLYADFFSILVMVLLTSLLHQLVYQRPAYTTILTTVVAFGFDYMVFALATLAMLLACYGLQQLMPDGVLFESLCFTIVGAAQLFIAFLLFRLRRLKNGMPFLQKQTSGGVGGLISMGILLMASIPLSAQVDDLYLGLALLGLLLFGFALYGWWRKRLTRGYRDRLRQQEQEALQQTAARQQEEIGRLTAENESMAKIIHKDNKLIPAMELAVRQLLSSFALDDAQRDSAAGLLHRLESMSAERQGVVKQYETAGKRLLETGVAAIDTLTAYFLQKAAADGTAFDVSITASVAYMTEAILSEEQLSTIAADLLENALIAVRGQERRQILLQIGMEKGYYCLAVYDSGIPFEARTLVRAGKEKATTHADTGGSGIGLMTLFELCAACQASFEIDEQIVYSGFTKKVAVCFDGAGAYRLRTSRPDIIQSCSGRPDIQIIPVIVKPADE